MALERWIPSNKRSPLRGKRRRQLQGWLWGLSPFYGFFWQGMLILMTSVPKHSEQISASELNIFSPLAIEIGSQMPWIHTLIICFLLIHTDGLELRHKIPQGLLFLLPWLVDQPHETLACVCTYVSSCAIACLATKGHWKWISWRQVSLTYFHMSFIWMFYGPIFWNRQLSLPPFWLSLRHSNGSIILWCITAVSLLICYCFSPALETRPFQRFKPQHG